MGRLVISLRRVVVFVMWLGASVYQNAKDQDTSQAKIAIVASLMVGLPRASSAPVTADATSGRA